MSKGDTTENDFIKIAFLNNYDPTWRTNGYLYISLHNADPGEAGNQTSHETVYTNYARVAVAKTAGGWTVVGGSVSNAALIQFNQCGASGDTITHVAIGTVDTPGTGQILYSGQLGSSLTVSNLIQPQFAIGALAVSED